MSLLYKYIDVLLLNKDESIILSRETDDIRKIMKKLHNLGPKTIAITNGGDTVFVCDKNILYSSRPYDVKISSTLGAGDAFCSGFVAGLIKNQTIEESLKLGLLNSSFVIQHTGAKTGLLYHNNIKTYEGRLKQKLVVHKEEFLL